MRTVVVGVGNPTLTDDGVGIAAARALAERVDDPAVDVTYVCAGGLRLMETMIGYDAAIVVDALTTGGHPAGTAVELNCADFLADLAGTRNLNSVHDLSLPYALELGRAAGVALPERIRVFGVEADDVVTFSEELTPAVAAALPALVDRVLAVLGVLAEPAPAMAEPAPAMAAPAAPASLVPEALSPLA
jgi:hydrogenase maturation protease